MKKPMFEKPESMKKEMREDAQKVKAVKSIANASVHKHEANMHKGEKKTKLAKGGMIARGGGAAKRGLGFTKNG
ncbi:MAG: hypothetical protein ABFD94_16680 [Armatimonadia bacterium]